MRFLLLSTLSCVAALLAAASGGVGATDNSAGRVLTSVYEGRDAGQRLFVRQGCYQCHGLVGQGSILSGPGFAPLRLADNSFRNYVRHPTGSMPPYSMRLLSDADLGQIERYIRSLPRAQPYLAIPALAAVVPNGAGGVPATGASASPAGEALYRRNCAACHGALREGGVGPSLVNEGRKRNAAQIAQLIMNPPPGMPKLYPAPLSRPEVDALGAYLVGAH